MADAKTPTLKIAKIVTHKPVKIPLTVDHNLNADLEAYAKIYKQTHGEEQPVNALIPHMLAAFLASDTGFKKAKRELV